jgi:ornithine carbamoyltransferase
MMRLCNASSTTHPAPDIRITRDPFDAVKAADAVYTDTFVSMGQEDEKAERLKDFAGYQLNAELMAAAPPHAIVLHCLPAYRGVEITADVIDGPKSRVIPQAHNRLHAQKGLLAVLLGR